MKKCKHMNCKGICTNGNSACDTCKLPCEHYETCKYHIEIPNVGLCCEAYYKSKNAKGKQFAWFHFPFCSDDDCPLKHPELLNGATLEMEE